MDKLHSEVKNVIHNDLGITKEYINEVIEKTVQNEIKKFMNDKEYIEGLFSREIGRSLYRKDNGAYRIVYDAAQYLKDTITKTLLDTIRDRVVITLKEDEGNYNIDDFRPVKDEESGHYYIERKED